MRSKKKQLTVRVNSFGRPKEWAVSPELSTLKIGEKNPYGKPRYFKKKDDAIKLAIDLANSAYFDDGVEARVFFIDYESSADGLGEYIYDASSLDD